MHFRHNLLFYLQEGKNECSFCQKFHEVYGDNDPKKRQFENRCWKFDINNAPQSGWPTETDDDKIVAALKSIGLYTMPNIEG